MSFLLKIDSVGTVLQTKGNVFEDRSGTIFALNGIGQGGLVGLAEAFGEHHSAFTRDWLGQFSAAILAQGKLVLAQSSLGLGRAYYTQSGGTTLVGSDLSDVASQAGCFQPDPIYFSRFLQMRPVLDRTPYLAVRRLFGGETIEFKGEKKRSFRPWIPRNTVPKPNALDHLHSLLREAVDFYSSDTDTTMIDVSGGTDSSLVAAIAVSMGRRLKAISYIPQKGAQGHDRFYAKLISKQLALPLIEIGKDLDGLTTELDRLPNEPGSCSYQGMLKDIDARFRLENASCHLTGVGGDVIFDFGGLAPAFLADPIVKGRLFHAWKRAKIYAQERGGHRSATHFLRFVGLPIATSHLLRRNAAEQLEKDPPNWLAPGLSKLASGARAPFANAIRRPSSRYLWEMVFNMTASENLGQPWSDETHSMHPLLHRPLVEYCLSLSSKVRRGESGDRALQRELLNQLGLKEVAERTDKGSSQPSREMDLQNQPLFLEVLRQGELVRRGWVEPIVWSRAIDQIGLGVSPSSTSFAAAIECELWLQRAVQDGRILPASQSDMVNQFFDNGP